MLASSIFDHPWFLVLIALVTLIRWLASRGKSTSQEAEPPEPPARPPSSPIPRGGETRSEEERIRRFLEALGQPPGSSPPPPVTPRRRQVTPKVWQPPYSPLPPLKTAPPPLPTDVTAPSFPPPLPVEPVSQPRARALEPVFEVREVAPQTSSEPPPEAPRATRFAGRIKFGTPQDLRTAIVLREIFGPPRALQPLDLTSAQ